MNAIAEIVPLGDDEIPDIQAIILGLLSQNNLTIGEKRDDKYMR